MAERLKGVFCSKIRSIARSGARTASFDFLGAPNDGIADFTLTIERTYLHSRLHWKGTFTRQSESLILTGYLDYQEREEKHNIGD